MNNLAFEDTTIPNYLDFGTFVPHKAASNTQSSPSFVALGHQPLECETIHPVWAILLDGVSVPASKPIKLRVSKQGESFTAENESLNIVSLGETREEAISEALRDLAYFYSYYGALPENEVIGYGITLRDRYISLLKR